MFSFIRLLLLAAVVYILYKVLWKGERLHFFKFPWKRRKPHPQKSLEEMKKDPVCGTYLPENQAIRYKSGGETYFFCSEECQQKFRQLREKT